MSWDEHRTDFMIPSPLKYHFYVLKKKKMKTESRYLYKIFHWCSSSDSGVLLNEQSDESGAVCDCTTGCLEPQWACVKDCLQKGDFPS